MGKTNIHIIIFCTIPKNEYSEFTTIISKKLYKQLGSIITCQQHVGRCVNILIQQTTILGNKPESILKPTKSICTNPVSFACTLKDPCRIHEALRVV